MDKLTVISGCLFFLADVFAIASLANPEWIVIENAGMKLGLTQMCQTIGKRNPICTYPNLSSEWTCTLSFIGEIWGGLRLELFDELYKYMSDKHAQKHFKMSIEYF